MISTKTNKSEERTFEELDLSDISGSSFFGISGPAGPFSLDYIKVSNGVGLVHKTYFITDEPISSVEQISGVNFETGAVECASVTKGVADPREVPDGALVEVAAGQGYTFRAKIVGFEMIGDGEGDEDGWFVLFEVEPSGTFLATKWSTTQILNLPE